MAYAAFEDYQELYGESSLDGPGFARLVWEAERAMDEATAGVDGLRKLRLFPPKDGDGAEAVRRCACALVDTLRRIEQAQAASSMAQSLAENADGTVHGRVVTSVTSGAESVSYAAGSAAGVRQTAVDAAAGDRTARARLLADTVRSYLAGVPDANGVNLTYMGRYPVRLG